MSSNNSKTQITRVECTDTEEDNDFSLSSDSDQDLEDNRYETIGDDMTVLEPALDAIKDLFIKNNFNELEIIQKKSSDVVNTAYVCHTVLTDTRVDDQSKDALFESKDNVFLSKAKLMKDLELEYNRNRIEVNASHGNKCNKKLTKSDVQINVIPNTFDEFLNLILELNAILIEDQNSKIFFREETHNREIRFQSHTSYINAFIPFLLRELWTALKESHKKGVNKYWMCYRKSDDNIVICSHIRDKSCNESMFRFGQIVVINHSSGENLESDTTEPKLLFGIVIEVKTHLKDKTCDELSDPLIQSQIQENDFIFEEILIYCKPLAESIEKVSVMPLTCVQKYLLEARVVYELKEPQFENIFRQILKPNFKFEPTGLTVNLEHRTDLFDVQKDAIQKAYEVCCLPAMAAIEGVSTFVAVYGTSKTGKTEALIETILQLVKCADFKVDKLLVITRGTTEMKTIIDFLKKNEIKVFHIDSEDNCLTHKKSDIKRMIRKMEKELLFNEIVGKDESYGQCLRYYKEEIKLEDMSAKEKYVREQIKSRVFVKLMTESNVIIGSIGSVMNDEFFNIYYNRDPDNNITCALIDNAHLFTETEVLTLLYAGVRGFALYGDTFQSALSHEKCESFFQRYVRLYTQNYREIEVKSHSVLQLRETIASLQRLSKRERNRSKTDPRHQRKQHFNNRFNNYRNQSNYGSEFFNRNNRFSDGNGIKTESKEDIKPYNQSNSYPIRDVKPDNRTQKGFGSQNRYNSSGYAHNLMTDGIVPQVAFGNRESYLDRTQNPSDYINDQSYGSNFDGMSTSNPNPYYVQQNNTQFVSNPSRHQNHDLF